MAEQTVILRYNAREETLDLPLDEPFIERLFKLENIILRDGQKAIQLHKAQAGKIYDVSGDKKEKAETEKLQKEHEELQQQNEELRQQNEKMKLEVNILFVHY